MDLIDRLDALRERWNVLRHPFYVRWERGELTRDELGVYAGQYRSAVAALAEAAAAAGDPDHAAEEAAHVALWDEFAAAVDAPADAEASPETSVCTEAWSGAADRLEADAILYALESSQPAIARTKLEGLVTHYGFRGDEPATEYFRVHAVRDHEHAERARTALADAKPADADRLAAKAEAALQGNWTLLDGVS